jgi:hypothetical protein
MEKGKAIGLLTQNYWEQTPELINILSVKA